MTISNYLFRMKIVNFKLLHNVNMNSMKVFVWRPKINVLDAFFVRAWHFTIVITKHNMMCKTSNIHQAK